MIAVVVDPTDDSQQPQPPLIFTTHDRPQMPVGSGPVHIGIMSSSAMDNTMTITNDHRIPDIGHDYSDDNDSGEDDLSEIPSSINTHKQPPFFVKVEKKSASVPSFSSDITAKAAKAQPAAIAPYKGPAKPPPQPPKTAYVKPTEPPKPVKLTPPPIAIKPTEPPKAIKETKPPKVVETTEPPKAIEKTEPPKTTTTALPPGLMPQPLPPAAKPLEDKKDCVVLGRAGQCFKFYPFSNIFDCFLGGGIVAMDIVRCSWVRACCVHNFL